MKSYAATGGRESWKRARRANLLSGFAVAVVLALVLATGLSLGLALQQPQPEPAAAPTRPNALAVPNQIWVPSPWTPGTASAGPIGPWRS